MTRMSCTRYMPLMAILSLSLGCTHLQLQKNALRQAQTVSGLYEQQVLDNLAMFTCNSHATPFFSVPDSGTNQVQDTGKAGAGAGAFTKRFWNFVSADGTRVMNESWTLKPVIDSNRLRLMQCAYQHAMGIAPDYCLDCCKLETDWHGSNYVCNDPCGITCGWLNSSTKWSDVPKCCCKRYGYYCGTYVWVEPCYEHEFSKLVMKIVEYATKAQSEKKSGPNKEVRFYLQADNKPGTIENHSRAIIATVGADKTIEEIAAELKIPFVIGFTAQQKEELEQTRAKLETLKNELADPKVKDSALEDQRKAIQSIINRVQPLNAELIVKNRSALENIDGQNTHAVEATRNQLRDALTDEIERLSKEIERLSQEPAFAPARQSGSVPTDFGQPTQFNGSGGNLLDLQQSLNTLTPIRE